MNTIDHTILDFFILHRIEWLSFVMMIITYAASYIVVITVTTLSTISFLIHRHYARILPFLITVGGSALTTFLLKNFFDRMRPMEAIYTENSFSFPSGHATAAMALYGFLLYTICKFDKHKLKTPFIFFLTLLILLVGLSRLYLGVHYFSDVLVGYLIGLMWLVLSIKLHKHLLRFEQLKDKFKSKLL